MKLKTTRYRLKLFLIAVAFIMHRSSSIAQKDFTKEPIRAAWLTNVGSDLLTSRDKIKEAVQYAKMCGLNTIITVTWNRGYTQYKSATMKKYFGIEVDPAYGGRDPLQELIEEAHKENIKVIAWFEFGFSNAYQDTGKYILDMHPEWASRDISGKILEDNGFTWMNPFHPKVQKFISNLVLEVVKKYDVDGVQGDDRLPALPAKGGYDDYTKNLYKKEHNGYEPPTNHFDSAWTEWRCLRLNNYAKKLYKDVKKIKPDMMVAHAPSLWPWCKKYYLQDWPTWLKDGYADVVLPQLYRYKIEDYQHILDETISYIGKENIPKLFPGILTSLADGFQVKETLLLQMIQANRKSGVMGESFFYFECLRRIPEFFKKNYVGK